MPNQASQGGRLPFDPVERAFALWQQRWGTSTSMLAVTSLMRAHQLVLAEVDAIVKPYDLTFARYEALVLLTFSRRGSLPLSKIGERLQVHPTSVTNIVDRLTKSGLVERRPNPEDGRGVLAEITPDGRVVVEKATADLMAAQFGLGALDSEQHQSLFATLRTLRLAAGDFTDPGVPDAGVAGTGVAGGAGADIAGARGTESGE